VQRVLLLRRPSGTLAQATALTLGQSVARVSTSRPASTFPARIVGRIAPTYNRGVHIVSRFILLALVGVLLLVVGPAAFGDSGTYQLVTPDLWGYSDCPGFVVEAIDGTADGCVPFPAGVTPINVAYSAASNGSIVFMANDNADPSSGDVGSIWLVSPNGPPVHLDTSPWDFDPTIAYNGSKVVFARYDPATASSDIYSINSDGSDLQLVVSGGAANLLKVPSISPDGSAIAYWCQGDCGPLTDGTYRGSGVMRVNIDGTDPRMILIAGGLAVEPGGPNALNWSPDDQWIALDGPARVCPCGDIYTYISQAFAYKTDGSDLFNNVDPSRQITHETDPWGASFPQFSPDGTQILYRKSSNDNGNQGNFSYLIGVDGTNRHEVSLNPDPLTCINGTCNGYPSYGQFIPTATPVAPPPLVDATHITVPSVHALDIKAASSDLRAKNLTVGKVTYKYSASLHKNRVLGQYPKAGAVAHRTRKKGPSVNLVVSRGRRHHRR